MRPEFQAVPAASHSRLEIPANSNIAFSYFLRKMGSVAHRQSQNGQSWVRNTTGTVQRTIRDDQIGYVMSLPPAVGHEALWIITHSASALLMNLSARYPR